MLLGERDTGLRKVTVILNVGSGSGRNTVLLDRIRSAFEGNGWSSQIALASPSARPDQLAREAVARGDRILVAAGGDGTVSSVASAVAGTSAILGVLPMGTLNHFAKDLHIPLDIEHAIAVIQRGKTANIDVGEVNGRIFVNNSSLGLYPSMVFERDLRRRRTGGSKWIAAFWAALTVLWRFRSLRVRLGFKGQTVVRKSPFVFVGNNEYQIEGLNVGTRARLDSGQLSLYVAQTASRARVIWLSLAALFGRLRTAKDFESFCINETWVDARRKRLRISLDGEVAVLRAPLHYRVRPGALRVFVP
jgi:diacylglycerol kinase family enzyme